MPEYSSKNHMPPSVYCADLGYFYLVLPTPPLALNCPKKNVIQHQLLTPLQIIKLEDNHQAALKLS